MIIGVGIDIIETNRIKKAIAKKHFINRLFTTAEQQYCEMRAVQKHLSYAGRFAAKEAFVKALGTGFIAGEFTDIEVLCDELGKPYFSLHGHYRKIQTEHKINKIHLSISHSKDYAVAQVILEE